MRITTVFVSMVVPWTIAAAPANRSVRSIHGMTRASTRIEPGVGVDSVPVSAAEDAPLTLEKLSQFATIRKAMEVIGHTHPLDSLARARHLPVDQSFPITSEMSRDSARRIQRTLAVGTVAMLSMPEAAPAFANAPMTPIEFFWIGRRLQFAWQEVESASITARITGQTRESMLAQIPTMAGMPDADKIFVNNHEAEARAALGLPSRDAESTPIAHANTTVTPMPSGGPLDAQLVKEVAAARAAGQIPVVEIVDPDICGPACTTLDQALERPPLVEIFRHVRLIKVGYLTWHRRALEPLKFCTTKPDGSFSCEMMHFVGVTDAGHASDASFTVTAKNSQASAPSADKLPDALGAVLAPQFKAFLEPLQSKK